uniref:Uncharacterized protein n=1 Tax=Lepeophtheirus salmonis TaxID=72036 RepID=A0A0K2TLW2_LEPSM
MVCKMLFIMDSHNLPICLQYQQKYFITTNNSDSPINILPIRSCKVFS